MSYRGIVSTNFKRCLVSLYDDRVITITDLYCVQGHDMLKFQLF